MGLFGRANEQYGKNPDNIPRRVRDLLPLEGLAVAAALIPGCATRPPDPIIPGDRLLSPAERAEVIREGVALPAVRRPGEP